MCCITTIICQKCARMGRPRVDLCDRNNSKTMCIKSESHITKHITVERLEVINLHVSDFMGAVKYPGECFPTCPSTEMVMRKDLIKLKNSVELSAMDEYVDVEMK